MIRWFKEMPLLNILLVPIMLFLPALSLTLPRTPESTTALFFLGPLSAGFYTLLYSQPSAAPWRRGAEAVRQWRAESGGYLHTIPRACAWMFGTLILSYGLEFAVTLMWMRHD